MLFLIKIQGKFFNFQECSTSFQSPYFTWLSLKKNVDISQHLHAYILKWAPLIQTKHDPINNRFFKPTPCHLSTGILCLDVIWYNKRLHEIPQMRIINCERLCLSLSCLDYVDIILLFFLQDSGGSGRGKGYSACWVLQNVFDGYLRCSSKGSQKAAEIQREKVDIVY